MKKSHLGPLNFTTKNISNDVSFIGLKIANF